MLCSIDFHNFCLFKIIIDSQSFVTSYYKIFIFQKSLESHIIIKNVLSTYLCKHAVFLLESFHDFVERIFIFDKIDNYININNKMKMIMKKYKILLSFLKYSLFLLSILI